MNFAKTAVMAASALALAVGSAWAADADKPLDSKNKDGHLSKTEASNATRSDYSGFAKLDKNKDGYISKTEAKAEPELAKTFSKWDMNNDGKINRAEYLAAMAKEDTSRVASKVKEKFSDKDSSTGGSSKPAK